ncbi:MAG: hypothetical protein V3T08_06770 [Gemmatimonadota bacterium]
MTASKRILLIQVEGPVRDALARLMAAEGHEVRVASGAEEALDRLGELRPDVVLYDAESFGSEASQAIARFREQAGRHCLIALTGGPSSASGGGGGGGAGGGGGPGIDRADFAFPRPTNLDELRRVLREA